MRTALSLASSTGLTHAAARPAAAAPRAGVAAAVRGTVTLERSGSVGVAVQTGAQIYLGDRIATGPEGGLQVLLLDESTFTLGPNSALVIDRFVYDPKGDSGELQTELVRGAFRFVSGKIAKRDPGQMKVKLPAGTIGVRGTIVGAQVDPSTGHSRVWLAGPGAGNSAGIPAGSIRVENVGVAQDVARSGWGVEIPDFTSPPSPPFPMPDTAYGTLGFEVAPHGSAGSDDAYGSSPGTADDAGLEPLALLPPGEPSSDLRMPLVSEPLGGISNPIPPNDASFTPTTLGELAELSASFDGQFLFNLRDIPLASGGNLDLLVGLDLAADLIGVQVLDVNSSAIGSAGMGSGVAALSIPRTGGDARFVAQFPYFETAPQSSCGNGCPVTVDFGFLNTSSQVAGQLEAQVQVGPVTLVETTAPQSVPLSEITSGAVVAP